MKIPQFRPFVDLTDYAYLKPVFENNSYIAEGPFAKQFHDELLAIIGAKHAVFACNGTVALYLAMRALGIGEGDEVLVQDVTFIASANSVEMTGAKPVFVDVPAYNDLTVNLDAIRLNDRVRGLIVAHLFGTACSNIEEVRRFCLDNGLFLIEDAAQALAITNGRTHCGTFGHVGTFSFYADKTITTAEGGLVVTDSEEAYQRMLYLRNQGRKHSGTFVHPEIGYNFRITDIQAALGVSQLRKLEHIKRQKQWIYGRYRAHLDGRVDFLRVRDDFTHIPFRVVVFVDNAEATMQRMCEKGIEPRSMFYPLHRQPCYGYLNCEDADFKNADECFRRGICLPTWVGLTEEQIAYVSDALIEALG